MSYIKQIKNFWALAPELGLKPTEIAIYLNLLEVSNVCESAQFCRNSTRVMLDIGVKDKRTFDSSILRLEETGLIQTIREKGNMNVTYIIAKNAAKNVAKFAAKNAAKNAENLQDENDGEMQKMLQKMSTKYRKHTSTNYNNKSIASIINPSIEQNSIFFKEKEKEKKINFDSNSFQELKDEIVSLKEQLTSKRKKVAPKKEKVSEGVQSEPEARELVYPFPSENFIEWWGRWKEYKQSVHKFEYKTALTEQAALNELAKKADMREDIAIRIIEVTIGSGRWLGLTVTNEIKELIENGKPNNSNSGRPNRHQEYVDRVGKGFGNMLDQL